MEPRNRCQGINSASLCSMAGRYDNPIPTPCLAPIDFLKIPALECTLCMPRPKVHILLYYFGKSSGWAQFKPRFLPSNWTVGLFQDFSLSSLCVSRILWRFNTTGPKVQHCYCSDEIGGTGNMWHLSSFMLGAVHEFFFWTIQYMQFYRS